MKITFKICFLLRSGAQGKEKLKRGHIKKNFFNDTEENSIFSVARKGFSLLIKVTFVLFFSWLKEKKMKQIMKRKLAFGTIENNLMKK
jgi:hypothetical protein